MEKTETLKMNFEQKIDDDFGELFTERMRGNEDFGVELWSALANVNWRNESDLDDTDCGHTFRSGGALIVSMLGRGDYMDWYCSGLDGVVSEYIADAMESKGWRYEIIRYDEIIKDDLPITERFNGAAYRRYIRLAKISDVLDKDAILRNLNCAGLADGKLCFTNAGALFFRVNDEDVLFRHAGIVCSLYKGTNKANILDAKELNGDIVSNVDDAMIFLKKHLRMRYKIESLQRQNILELPEDALREAVVNAVCHRDYFEKGARVMVEIYDDRVEIVSPGGVCKGITRENFGTVSNYP